MQDDDGPAAPGDIQNGQTRTAPRSREGSRRFDRQKQRILDAATLILNEKGVWGMTLQEVAGALDLTTSSVTYYFRRREHLTAAVFEDSLSRLAAIAEAASREDTPRRRVARYVELFFDRYARARRGNMRAFANLAEIRTLEEASRAPLVAQYQDIFRTIRGFFGPAGTEERKMLLTARTHILNEALFWAEIWLPAYAATDFPNVRDRLLDILDGGLATPRATAAVAPLRPDVRTGGNNRQAFMRVATRLINQFGYRGASVERITAELKRNKADFYRHIDGKDDLVTACSRKSYHRLAALQRLARRRYHSPWDRISATLGSALALQFGDEFPLLRSSALQALPPPIRRIAVEQANRTILGVMGGLVDGMAEGTVRIVDPLIAAHIALSAVDAAYDLKSWREREPLDRAVLIYRSVIEQGLFDPTEP